MADGTQQEQQDAASIAGHAQPVVDTAADRVEETYRAFLGHVQGCGDCRTDGMDCEEAAGLRQGWRAATAAVVPPR